MGLRFGALCHGLFSFKVFFNTLFGNSQGSGQGNFRVVVRYKLEM